MNALNKISDKVSQSHVDAVPDKREDQLENKPMHEAKRVENETHEEYEGNGEKNQIQNYSGDNSGSYGTVVKGWADAAVKKDEIDGIERAQEQLAVKQRMNIYRYRVRITYF